MPHTLTVSDPRTGDLVAEVPIPDGPACDAAVARARSAFTLWSRTSAAERAAALRAAARAVEDAVGGRHVTDATENGARALIGGEPRPGPGISYPPTVLADCTPDMLAHRVGRPNRAGPAGRGSASAPNCSTR